MREDIVAYLIQGHKCQGDIVRVARRDSGPCAPRGTRRAVPAVYLLLAADLSTV
jgi:hypothetical protein